MNTSVPQNLYIQPEEYLELVNNPETADQFAKLFFNAQKPSPQHEAICELLNNFLVFATSRLSSDFASCALFTALVDLHSENISSSQADLYATARNRLLQFSLEIPTFYTAPLEYSQSLICAEFLDEFYCQTGSFWRFLFSPQPILSIKSRQINEIVSIQSIRQLGVVLGGAEEPKATKGGSRPGSKSGAQKPDLTTKLEKAKYEYNVTLQPLSQAVQWFKPAPPTADEKADEQIKEIITEVKMEETQNTDKESEIDVDKMAEAIKIAAQNELDKVKTRVLQELETKNTKKK
ncbi:putative Flagellar C1a complex subunit C1a-32 [Spironucleus salmonicida]|uniref:Flagellar C1a complex subunit C1a-32 n=1 Tax=Spironucleus salmonicida TaxID=348837 RepID=V6LRJ0_9EUKA|nr:putative Flagellar C1a complex subunit C1a-32 [Spironucleus salmonicida]|eukprot:EST46883.1 hypothetical protein SS50377_13035 [Spironucleus salmonicida]